MAIFYYDFLIFKDKQLRGCKYPRRINEGEYQIEWHRKGIQFLRCPEGWLCHQDNPSNCIPIATGTIVPWSALRKDDKFDITTLSGEKQFVVRIYYRTVFNGKDNGKDHPEIGWLEKCEEMDHNVNREMLWYIAEYYEGKWEQTTSSKETKNIYEELIVFFEKLKDLHTEVDNDIRELLLKTWQQRLQEQLITDLSSQDESIVIKSIACLKDLI